MKGLWSDEISFNFNNYVLLICEIASATDSGIAKDVRTFINLMDYIGTDYHNAVENGKIKDKDEYSEMVEFIGKSITVYDSFSNEINSENKSEIKNNLVLLQKLINEKENKEKIFTASNKIKQEILRLNIIPVAPDKWADIENGKKLFGNNCVTCHGSKGDGNGSLSKSLNPKPANLLNDTLMSAVSPFQVYNTVRLGISGTSMASFDGLTDNAVWDIAFYVSSLRFKNRFNIPQDSLASLYKKATQYISLEQVATLSDNELLTKLDDHINDKLYLAAIRLHKNEHIENASILSTSVYLDDVLNFYKSKEYSKAEDKALFAYLDVVEPYEGQLETINSELKSKIESWMFKLRSDIKGRKSVETIEQDVNQSKLLVSEAASQLNSKTFSFWFAFLFAASIILREGIEAFLIIITIIGVLKSINAGKAVRWVHGGWITALFIGVASMFFINLIVSMGSQNRELMEGIGSLLAVILLLYIGFWLHSKTEVKKWKEFVETKIQRLVNGKNMTGLFAISFIVVFREAFESAIFLSAVNLEVEQGSKNGLYFGAISSLVVVLLLAWIAVRFTAKLPIRKLFVYSAMTMAVLAVVLVGKGIHALQESGYSSITQIPVNLKLSLLGIYPTIETFIAQVVILIFTILLYNYSKKLSS